MAIASRWRRACTLPNEASVRLHEKFGFAKVAEFQEIGVKFGQWTPVGYWQKLFVSP